MYAYIKCTIICTQATKYFVQICSFFCSCPMKVFGATVQTSMLNQCCHQNWSHTVCVKVNKNFAINLVAEEPVTDVESRVVSCDGGGGALGHPKVYINLVKPAVWRNSLKWCICQFLFEPMCFITSARWDYLIDPVFFFFLFLQDKDTKIGTCGYCGLRFKQKHHHWNMSCLLPFINCHIG